MKKSKILGQVYTPSWIVTEILDNLSYSSDGILEKFILEPSCGDGAFLCEIVNRYIEAAELKEWSVDKIISGLQTYVYGVEIDESAYTKCIENLNKVVEERLSVKKVQWKVFHQSIFDFYTDYFSFFDYVVGNPPYIRIHNLDEKTRVFLKTNFRFSIGTIDIYLSFFELGIKLLNKKRKLGYITPNSFLHNASYKEFRYFLKEKKIIKSITDFKSEKIFQGFSTYTAITIIDKAYSEDSFVYKELVNNQIEEVNKITFNSLNPKKWNFSSNTNDTFLKKLFENKHSFIKEFFDVQYGFATLRDKIYIGDKKDTDQEKLCYFNDAIVERSILKKIVKASRYKGEDAYLYILFPYELIGHRYTVIKEEKLKKEFPNAYNYLLQHKKELEKRDMDKGTLWYEFGRSQGIQTIHNEKIVLSTLVNGSIDFYHLPKDVMVYSGIFIIKNNPSSQWSMVEEVLASEDFYRYIRITGKDFSGGYKSISTKQIKEYRVNFNNSYTLF